MKKPMNGQRVALALLLGKLLVERSDFCLGEVGATTV
jgi:hypothetical protein